jgi:AbrB family looped-hinge helix DNA binding protein
MSKVTSKLQVTLPKALADQFGIKPGDEINWEAAGDQIRVTPQGKKSLTTVSDLNERLRLFDQATARQRKRAASRASGPSPAAKSGRGWTREELYGRGRH